MAETKNLITQKTEFKGLDINDRTLNSIFLDSKEILPKAKFAKQLVMDIIDSDRLPEYNPFFEFIEEYKHLKPKGNIEALLSCFDIPDDKYGQLVGSFVEKWLISIIASLNGTYSLLILVLIGGQGTGKTEFFRNLLPKELRKYYGESKLDAGKDDEILMTLCVSLPRRLRL